MITKKKAASAKPNAALKHSPEANHNSRSRIKATIVYLALRELIPFPLADWLIQRGGMRHE